MTSPEHVGLAPEEAFIVESMPMLDACTMRAVSRDFEGVNVRVLDPIVEADAEDIVEALNERDARFMASAGFAPPLRPYNGTEFYNKFRECHEAGGLVYPFVLVTAQPDADGGSAATKAFYAKVREVWAEEIASSTEATPRPSVLDDALGRLVRLALIASRIF